MDSVTMVRLIAGIVAVVLLAIIVARRKRMGASKPTAARRP